MCSEKVLLKILFVEDDEVFFNCLAPRLLKAGLLILRAKDGQEAILTARKEIPDLIVIDVVLPKYNGFEVIKILKEKPLTNLIKYIILSDYGESQLIYDESFRSSLGIEKYLIKSKHTPTEIVREIKEVLTH